MLPVQGFDGYYFKDDRTLIRRFVTPMQHRKLNNTVKVCINKRYVKLSSVVKSNRIPKGENSVLIKGTTSYILTTDSDVLKIKDLPIQPQVLSGKEKRIYYRLMKNGKPITILKSKLEAAHFGISDPLGVMKRIESGSIVEIPDFPGYFISEQGEVFSVDRHRTTWVALKPHRTKPTFYLKKPGALKYNFIQASVLLRKSYEFLSVGRLLIEGATPLKNLQDCFINSINVIIDSEGVPVTIYKRVVKLNRGYPYCVRIFYPKDESGKKTMRNYDIEVQRAVVYPKCVPYQVGKNTFYIDSKGHIFSERFGMMSPFYTSAGSKGVSLSGKHFNAAKVIATCLIPNPLEHNRIKFLDGDQSNLHPSNLEWESEADYQKRKFEKMLSARKIDAAIAISRTDNDFLKKYYTTRDNQLLRQEFSRIDKKLSALPYWHLAMSRVFEYIHRMLDSNRVNDDLLPYARSLAYYMSKEKYDRRTVSLNDDRPSFKRRQKVSSTNDFY